MKVTIYHNPRCSKSRKTLELLREKGIEPRIVEYLKDPPDAAQLRRLVGMLGIRAADLLRRGEPEYRELGLDAAGVTDDQCIDAMARHPRLMERPVVVCGERARIGRPPENVLEIVSG